MTMSVTARSERPINRWISCVRPEGRPLATSRSVRSDVEPGSIEYSAVTQPLPRPRIHGGTRSSTDAVHSTRVLPMETSTDPAANSVKSRWNVNGRRSSGSRPSFRGLMVEDSCQIRLLGGGHDHIVAERRRRVSLALRGVDGGPEVGDHQLLDARLARRGTGLFGGEGRAPTPDARRQVR